MIFSTVHGYTNLLMQIKMTLFDLTEAQATVTLTADHTDAEVLILPADLFETR